MMQTLGFIGVGTIATATVHGLRAAWPDLHIHLSPRSAVASQALAALDPKIHREASNAAVVAASDAVILSVLPTQLDGVLGELQFRAGQIVVSCVAGMPLAEVAALVEPARACRLVPLPMIARREGPIVLHPALPEIRHLFEGLGDLIVPDDERDFATYAAGSATMSTFFALQAAVSGWMTARGTAAAPASIYVHSLFRALAETGRLTTAADLPGLVERHETPGGLNARMRRSLEAKGWFTAPEDAFDGIARLGRKDLCDDDA